MYGPAERGMVESWVSSNLLFLDGSGLHMAMALFQDVSSQILTQTAA